MKNEYLKRAWIESRAVIIRQYCRIIAKFIDRKQAEELIDKIINIVRFNSTENEDNDQTYYNYYGGKNAACQAFINHLTVAEPKYDAKLHLYLLEHIATKDYVAKLLQITNSWINKENYINEINRAVEQINQRSTYNS